MTRLTTLLAPAHYLGDGLFWLADIRPARHAPGALFWRIDRRLRFLRSLGQ